MKQTVNIDFPWQRPPKKRPMPPPLRRLSQIFARYMTHHIPLLLFRLWIQSDQSRVTRRANECTDAVKESWA